MKVISSIITCPPGTVTRSISFEALLSVGDVSDPEGHSCYIKGIIAKRELQRVALHDGDLFGKAFFFQLSVSRPRSFQKQNRHR